MKIIFQKSFDSGILPSDWKKNIIIPIYKNSGKPQELKSYRPVSLTSVVGKLMERILHNFLSIYIRSNLLISDVQHGFISGRSTTSNLLEYLNEVTRMVDQRNSIDVLCIDLARAFDTVSHDKLLYKLSKIGIGGKLLRWFRSFITGREQCVRVNRSTSPFIAVTSGIPQGTILGPLFFIIYIDGLSRLVTNKINLYADDSKLYGLANTDFDKNIFQTDINRICEFCRLWQLRINGSKCETLHFGANNPNYLYAINQDEVPIKNSYRDLGVIISNDLSMSEHCDHIFRIASFRFEQFNVSFACRDRSFRLFMFLTYIRPILECNSQVWSPHLIRDINKIERVQRNFTKTLSGLQTDVSYAQRLIELQIESLEQRRIFNDLCFLFKMVNGLVDMEIGHFFCFNNNNTRGHRFKLSVQYSRLNCRKFFFANRTVPIWNNLPSNVVESINVKIFKTRLSEVDLTVYCRGRAHTA